MSQRGEKWFSICLLSFCVMLTLSLWFSVSAVVPTLRATRGLSDARAAWLTSSVSIGFVAGTLSSAILGLADRFEPRRMFMLASLSGAAANFCILVVEPGSLSSIFLRFITGGCMAFIYPVGLRMAASWADRDMGLLAAAFTAAICLGSGLPHLADVFGGVDWRIAVGIASVLAASSALLILLVRLGPLDVRLSAFHPYYVLETWKSFPIRLANIGYWGHKWENYAMWTWIATYLSLSYMAIPGASQAGSNLMAHIVTFAIFAAAVPGCLLAGVLADRYGRTLVALSALAVSGCCAVLSTVAFGQPLWIVNLLVLVWGFALVADSGQFSASVIELSQPGMIGTLLTVQTCIGYLITLVSIHAIELAASWVGWQYAMGFLVLGPIVGMIATFRLRQLPDALKLASGRK